MDNIYTAVISLGGCCGIVQQLNRLGLRKFAYPFDWIQNNLLIVTDNIRTDFENFFDVEPVKIPNANPPLDIRFSWHRYKREPIHGLPKTDVPHLYGFPHHNCDLPEIRETFQRRIDRWKKILEENRNVILFAYETFEFDLSQIEDFVETMSNYYPELSFHLVVIHEEWDDSLVNSADEYIEIIALTDKYTIYQIHLKNLRQAISPDMEKFYDYIFGKYKYNLS